MSNYPCDTCELTFKYPSLLAKLKAEEKLAEAQEEIEDQFINST